MKRSINIFLAALMTFVLTLSLAGCGQSNPVRESEPEERGGQVAGENQEHPPTIVLDGTYVTKETPPKGLGTELTFTIDGKVTDNTGDGAGTYVIDIMGDFMTIKYQGVSAKYMLRIDSGKIFIDGVEYTSGDAGSELDYEPYTASSDDPYPGLIVGVITTDKLPVFIVDRSVLEPYIRSNLERYISDPGSLMMNGSADVQHRYDGRLVVDDSLLTYTALYINPNWTKEYGLAFTYSTGSAGNIYYEISGIHPTSSPGSETWIAYSLSLGRVLTQEEFGAPLRLSPDEAYALWPDDYEKYMR